MVFGLTVNAQKIVPLEKKHDYNFINRNEKIYFKDVNNILGKYLGTWIGAHGNKKYEFRITKSIRIFQTMKFDRLLISYIVSDLTGNIIENTTSLPESSNYIMKGLQYYNNGYYLNYVAKGGNCAQSGQILIYVDNKTMDVIFRHEADFVDLTECPTSINQYFPASVIFKLMKQ